MLYTKVLEDNDTKTPDTSTANLDNIIQILFLDF